ncbi:MAG: CDP-alcohol phosphatidyltransferase family protein [Halioglobus sp.]|nr:CDP-alcohol phosphatidyltransferase family protein [Halioglobus sp.]
MLRYLPNSLTVLRLLLALPLGVFILRENYPMALGVGLAAGLSDSLDGFFARRLHALSRFGAVLDPIADKLLISVCLVCFAAVQLVPWSLAVVIIARDLIIVLGAACYLLLYGPVTFAATTLSKCNMFVQVSFCLLVLLSEVVAGIPREVLLTGGLLIMFFAVASGVDYVVLWTRKAWREQRQRIGGGGDQNQG